MEKIFQNKKFKIINRFFRKIFQGFFSHIRFDYYLLNDGTIIFVEITFITYTVIAKMENPIFGDMI